ncbi:MAG: radical SAM protein [Theionarchaea archaeon]|nr:radical SAM protein [Theionarchaea archaeon]
MDIGKKPCQIEGALLFKENGMNFILNPQIPSWCMLDEVGYKVFQLCDGTATLEHIYEQVKSEVSLDTFLTIIRYLRKSLIIAFDSPHFEGISVSIPSLPPLTNLYIEITSRCNLRCIHCDVNAGQASSEEIPLEKIKECIDYLIQVKGWSMYISGGEPLLRKGWDELLDYSLKGNLKTTVATNGTLIDESTADTFLQHRHQDMILQISLDSTTEEVHDRIRGKGAFRKTVQGIENLLDRGLEKNMRISFTANKFNVREVDKMIDFCLNNGIGEVIFSKVYQQGRAAQVWNTVGLSLEEAVHFQKKVYKARKQLRDALEVIEIEDKAAPAVGAKVRICNMGQELRIDSAGNVYPCQLFDGSDAIIGNVTGEDIQSIREGRKFFEIRKKVSARADTIPKCQVCNWKNMCAAGCSATAHFAYGDMTAIDPMCEFCTWWHKYLILEQVKDTGPYHVHYC